MNKDNRTTFRTDVPDDEGVYISFGWEWFKNKFRVINLSDEGVCFLTHEEMEEGSIHKAYLRFPGLDDPLELDVKVVRVVKIETPAEPEKGIAEQKVIEWDVACYFEGISVGLQDRIEHEVRKIQRHDISANHEEEKRQE